MGSKNNPENRGTVTELRKYDGKEVEPVLLINGTRRFIAAKFKDGNELVKDPMGDFIPHASI